MQQELTPTASSEDMFNESHIRPQRLKEYLGQQAIKEQMSIYIDAAQHRQEALDHVLLFGPPGLGKTTLSHIIAREMKSRIVETSGPVLEKPGDLAVLLTTLSPRDVLFIDEIHRLSPVVEEVLYPAMEDYSLDILIGEGIDRKSVKIPLPPFTLIGATTRSGLLSAPLRDRFGIVQRLEFYSHAELTQIVLRSSQILGLPMDQSSALEVAKRSRGTPRIANRLLRRVRDVAQIKGQGKMSPAIVKEALEMLGINHHGLDALDQRVLTTLIDFFQGGPVGIESLAASLSEERNTLEDVVEPYLIQQGYMMRTSRGRMATALAYEHLGKSIPERLKSQ